MSRRLEVEITSLREDGTFTWRVVGAKQPKGEANRSILPSDAKVGDQLRAEADFLLDGIELLSVVPKRAPRKEPERLTITGSRPAADGQVTTQLVAKGDRPRRDRSDRGPRPDRGPRGDRGERADRGAAGRPPRERREGQERGDARPGGDRFRRPAPPPLIERPKPKRLRARRVHRDAVLAALPPEQVPIAEQIMLGGIPAVRQAIEKQNEQNRAAGMPEVHAPDLLTLAENLAPSLKAAEWRDRADAALDDVATLDLRDLRSVVVGADGAATDDDSRALAASLREALNTRVESEQQEWLGEIKTMITAGRTIRALRLSSRPPKAGSPIPAELAKELAAATVASVDDATTQDRWGALIDALAFSPIRALVVFEKLPSEPSPELISTVKAVADRVPAIASAFGIDPASASRSGRPKRRPTGTSRPIPPPPTSVAQTEPSVTTPTAEPVEASQGDTKAVASANEVGTVDDKVVNSQADVAAEAELAVEAEPVAGPEAVAEPEVPSPADSLDDAAVESATVAGSDIVSAPEAAADTEPGPVVEPAAEPEVAPDSQVEAESDAASETETPADSPSGE